MEKVIIVLGPTATHKTKLSLYLAGKFPVEIISADSMQFYIGMDIGTDKVKKNIQEQVPHHLIDIVTVQEEFSVAEFKKCAEKAIDDILRRDKIPLIVGGSGLYIRSITEGFPVEISAPPDKKLRVDLNKIPLEKLKEMAEKIDRDATENISKGDRKRLIRVIEFFRQTGKRISSIENKEVSYEFLKIGLIKAKKIIYKDIEARINKMFDRGFVEEVEGLKERYSDWSKTAIQAIGYREILQYLEGVISLEDAREEMKKKTRHLAKKQITWFKKERDVHWLDAMYFENAEIKAEKLVREFLYENSD